MLPNSDLGKWDYLEHTKAKHAILIRYMKAWLPILGTRSKQVVIVDAFAGRGRYATDEPGSPLLLRDIAGRVASDQRVDEVELFYIESNATNYATLTSELEAVNRPIGVIERPIRDEFERAAPGIVEAVQRTGRPSFWSIDPFGYAGLPLTRINNILGPRRSEVLITLMVRDINRFLDDPNHRQAHAPLFGLRGDELLAEIAVAKAAASRMHALRDLYVRRLEVTAGRQMRYVTSVGVSERGASDIVYFLVHATSSPKGKREMKEAIWEATSGLNAVIGARLEAQSMGQKDMFTGELRDMTVNYSGLKALLMERFSGRSMEHRALQDEAAMSHDFDGYIDSHIRTALDELATQGAIRKIRNRMSSTRRVADGDTLEFPAQ